MTRQAAAALRCPVCGGALMPLGTSLRCPQGHSYDMAKEGYVNLLAIQKRHAAAPVTAKPWCAPPCLFAGGVLCPVPESAGRALPGIRTRMR